MKTLFRVSSSMTFALTIGTVSFGQHYAQTNLVSNAVGDTRVTDLQLINPWGLSRGSDSPWWVSDNATSFSTLYNGVGAKQSLTVAMSQADPNDENAPRPGSHIHAHISSTPPGADIQVDGAYVGTTPLDIDLTCCFHDVTISKPGLKPWTGKVRNNGHANINVQLRK